jgi:hypothetical protein
MILCLAFSLATSLDVATVGDSTALLRLPASCSLTPQVTNQDPPTTPSPNSPQDPRPTPSPNGLQDVPAVPAGETRPATGEPETDVGGNPAPLPADNAFFLERQLSELGLGKHGIRVFGWTQGNYTASSANDFNTPTAFNDRADYFQLNQNWLEVVKTIDTTKSDVQFGARLGLIVPGYDYKYTRTFDMWETPGDRYGFDTTYMYAELYVPGVGPKGTTFRVGKWGTLIGYEMIEAIATPFVSRSYNFQYNPFTHTGVQATTELNGGLTMYHGVVTGADVFLNDAATPGYVGGLKWTSEGGATSVAANVFVTGQGWDTEESFQHYDSYNLLLQHTITEGWNYVLDATFGRTPDTVDGSEQATWWGLANYLSHALSDKVTLNLRGEVFRDADGLRTGTDGTYVAVTAGLQWMPQDWLYLRPFARFDRNSNGPFEGDDDLVTGGLEFIVRW